MRFSTNEKQRLNGPLRFPEERLENWNTVLHTISILFEIFLRISFDESYFKLIGLLIFAFLRKLHSSRVCASQDSSGVLLHVSN